MFFVSQSITGRLPVMLPHSQISALVMVVVREMLSNAKKLQNLPTIFRQKLVAKDYQNRGWRTVVHTVAVDRTMLLRS